MPTATFRFYEELNDFLSIPRRKRDISVNFKQRTSIKDMIESLGVPHTEVDLILVNGQSVDFNYIVQDGDRASVYPVFESLDIAPLNRLRPAPLRKTCFVLDTHLGKLAKYLRILGFDTLYDNNYHDDDLVDIAGRGDRRILLTRDRDLLKRKEISHGYFVRETNPRRQVMEITDRFDLFSAMRPFCYCANCNGSLNDIEKKQITGLVPEGVLERFDEFKICDRCRRIYWKGSHYDRMCKFIETLVKPRKDES